MLKIWLLLPGVKPCSISALVMFMEEEGAEGAMPGNMKCGISNGAFGKRLE